MVTVVEYKPFQRFGWVPHKLHHHPPTRPDLSFNLLTTDSHAIRKEGKNPSRGHTMLPDSVNSGTLVALPFACGQPGPLNL